jgi:hypothetical protein
VKEVKAMADPDVKEPDYSQVLGVAKAMKDLQHRLEQLNLEFLDAARHDESDPQNMWDWIESTNADLHPVWQEVIRTWLEISERMRWFGGVRDTGEGPPGDDQGGVEGEVEDDEKGGKQG